MGKEGDGRDGSLAGDPRGPDSGGSGGRFPLTLLSHSVLLPHSPGSFPLLDILHLQSPSPDPFSIPVLPWEADPEVCVT